MNITAHLKCKTDAHFTHQQFPSSNIKVEFKTPQVLYDNNRLLNIIINYFDNRIIEVSGFLRKTVRIL